MNTSFFAYGSPRNFYVFIFFRYVSLDVHYQKVRAQEPQIHPGAGVVIDGYGQNSVGYSSRIGHLGQPVLSLGLGMPTWSEDLLMEQPKE